MAPGPDHVHKFQMICWRGTKNLINEQKLNVGRMD